MFGDDGSIRLKHHLGMMSFLPGFLFSQHFWRVFTQKHVECLEPLVSHFFPVGGIPEYGAARRCSPGWRRCQMLWQSWSDEMRKGDILVPLFFFWWVIGVANWYDSFLRNPWVWPKLIHVLDSTLDRICFWQLHWFAVVLYQFMSSIQQYCHPQTRIM